MEITDAWLMEMGGWQEMKRARAMYAAGAVREAAFDGKRLTGIVRDTGKDLSSGLLLRSRSDMDNLCTCFQSRRHGTLCAHALAVGTAWVHRHEKPAAPSASSGGAASGKAPAAATAREQGVAGAAVRPAAAPGPLEFLLTNQLVPALERGKLGITVRTAGEAGLPAAPDAPLLLWLGSMQQTTVPPHLALSAPPQTNAALTALAGHPRVYTQEGSSRRKIAISGEPVRLPLTACPSGPQAMRLALRLPDADARFIPPAAGGQPGWIWNPSARTLAAVRVPAAYEEFLQSLVNRRPLEKTRQWLAARLDELQNWFEPDAEHSPPGAFAFRIHPAAPRFSLEMEGTLERLGVRLRVHYPNGPAPFPPGIPDAAGFPLESPGDPGLYLSRNRPAEDQAVRRLAACGFTPGTTPAAEWILAGENAVLQFLAGPLERLKKEWHVTSGQRFSRASAGVERLAPVWKPVPGQEPKQRGMPNDWLAFDLGFRSERGTTLDRVEIARLLATGTGHKKLPGGRIAVVSLEDAMDLNEVLRDVQPEQSSGSFRVRRSQLGYLENTFGSPLLQAAESPAFPVETTVPPELQAILRPYQKTGVQWLLDHAAHGAGGILADEMGLGKTLQSLSLAAALRRQWPDRPILVVCPKSLLGNWRAEAARFVPGLECVVLEGTGRKNQFARLPGAALVITSYQLLVRDLAGHRAISWGAIILDEAGFIRNPDTQAAQAARQLRGQVRFALTGTPVENSIRDLWSLMEFAVPGCLGPRKEFAERYESPLAAGGGPGGAVMSRLRRRMAPWLLRRLKTEVAPDLPAKIIQVRPCPASPLQKELLTALMREGSARILDAESSKQQGQARMHLLTTLLRLRQACCDPRLLRLELPETPPEETLSGKLEVLTELLEEIRDGGHSVIIFSAFASMLRLLRHTVEAAGLGCCHLDGQSRDRAEQVAAFQNDPDKRVFLISLKAGGYGLNLTKADTVIHFDPWWNPAVESQATDRAHRIGQERPVTVYKLITTGTVEEKILRLQDRKRHLMDAALDDEAPMMEGLTDDDLRELVG